MCLHANAKSPRLHLLHSETLELPKILEKNVASTSLNIHIIAPTTTKIFTWKIEL